MIYVGMGPHQRATKRVGEHPNSQTILVIYGMLTRGTRF